MREDLGMPQNRDLVERVLSVTNGILGLEAAWVARDFLPPGRRLGLSPAEYDVGERGFICERWLASTTRADNRVGPDDEGLSYVAAEGIGHILLKELVEADPAAVMGTEYAATHLGLGRLAKVFDFGARIPYHIHPRLPHARLVGRNSKEEAYYFPDGVEMGAHPETFFGVHPSLAERADRNDVLLPYLVDWDSDLILRHARGEVQVPGDGFHVPPGILHAPGTALTIELQEDSDAMLMFQALNAGRIISKELLFKDVHPDRRQRLGEFAALEWVDWEANGDPYFYENHHLLNPVVEGGQQAGGREEWLFGNTLKFSGKRLVVSPHAAYKSLDKGVYSVFAWRGQGTLGGVEIRGGEPGRDELLVSHYRATRPIEVANNGSEELVLFKFFGPDINDDVPRISAYRNDRAVSNGAGVMP
jgi:hypothetical protein